MNYQNMTPGIFLARPNRFIAQVQIGDQAETVHVKNTGRCRELTALETKRYFGRNIEEKHPYPQIRVQKLPQLRI